MADNTDRQTAVTVTRAELARVLREGRDAADRPAAQVIDCPYKPGGDANERMRAAAWIRAFLRARGIIGQP